ncbi:unnamed protein product [Adineta steineri]|uniref:Uncharacterized protein n=1 Tax=Adineta steineri TaxID=433720 RepID=A0A819B037_9BILA|nr:unnamed protein product [Adineta steineri]CAF1105236.1 unnamed protein product [Adineta steineri]CAF3737612.1 unnamed protein product [Adineta steineri]CAF3793672.1 unnamed protein product [Adineta steineri]
MNTTSTIIEENWFNDIQFGNKGAVLFMLAYIGFYGLGIICLLGHQLKETQKGRHELPAYFLKTLWDVPNKNKLYQELSDVERLKRIFNAYFSDHETYITTKHVDLQAMVEERANACALRYRQKLRRLHLSHTDYYLDTIPRLTHTNTQEQLSIPTVLTRTTTRNTTIDDIDKETNNIMFLSISVV